MNGYKFIFIIFQWIMVSIGIYHYRINLSFYENRTKIIIFMLLVKTKKIVNIRHCNDVGKVVLCAVIVK
jgi:hypothetical protein